MKHWMAFYLGLLALAGSVMTVAAAEPATNPKRAFILPVREDIAPPLVYVVRRGVKEAMEAKADLLLLDMETNGGQVVPTVEIMDILSQFKGRTVTYVNRNAYSAGMFIAVATQSIYMAPESVIGAAAPIMMSPGGMGVSEMPDTMEVKTTSALSAKVRAYAQKHGHNPDVVEAMIDKQKDLQMDGKSLNEKGNILTLTNTEAEREYGDPRRPLLSSGTVPSLDALLSKLGFAEDQRTWIKPTGAEKVATWINALNWLWLIIGVAGIYIEFKTPGFGLPGIVGICAFALYFLGGYAAGLSGLEWPAIFLLGLGLVALELFVFPGTVALGLLGTALMLVTIVMAMVDLYPGMPPFPTLPQLRVPLRDLTFALIGSIAVLAVLARLLPKTSFYGALVTQSASGVTSIQEQADQQAVQIGLEGVALCALRPGGKAQFGGEILDVMTEGDLIPKDARVRIIAHSGREAIVETIRS